MFPIPGFSDLILICLVVLLILGAGKLPAIAQAAARAVVYLRNRLRAGAETAAEDEQQPAARN